jgi:hypothetical protein
LFKSIFVWSSILFMLFYNYLFWSTYPQLGHKFIEGKTLFYSSLSPCSIVADTKCLHNKNSLSKM